MQLIRQFRARLCAALALVPPSTAFSGPPFITNDPEPTDLHKWEIYDYAVGSCENGVTGLDTGVGLNYGAMGNVQLTAVLPFHTETGAPLNMGKLDHPTLMRI